VVVVTCACPLERGTGLSEAPARKNVTVPVTGGPPFVPDATVAVRVTGWPCWIEEVDAESEVFVGMTTSIVIAGETGEAA
jgi:hypothetical protein